MVLHVRVVLDLCEQLEQEISFEQVEGDFDSFRGGRRIGFCKCLRVDGGQDAEIMREESGYGWVLQGRQRSLAAIGEEEKTLTEKKTLARFSKEDDARWLLVDMFQQIREGTWRGHQFEESGSAPIN
ncbi:unnamed protein product [Prunus armeniaca]